MEGRKEERREEFRKEINIVRKKGNRRENVGRG